MNCVKNIRNNFEDVIVSCQNIKSMNFKNNYYDIIYAHLTLHYFYDKDTTKIFNKIYDFLKPNGYFFVKCKSVRDFHYGEGKKYEKNCYAKKNKHLRHFFTEEYMRKKLKQFNIKKIKSTESVYNTQKSAFVEAIAIKSL
jgi:predicted SAM-dependent methyltransferase